MEIKSQKITYQDGNTKCEGYFAWDNNQKGKRPGVMIAPDWSGCGVFAKNKAEKLAELGYVGFAIDMYSEGQTPATTEERMALMGPLKENRALLRQRIMAAFQTAQQIEQIDPTRIAAMGFCFGGLCALDLARNGADVKGVVSFHGLLLPGNLPNKKITAKVLVLHGYDDPMVPPEQVLAFAKEMTDSKVDWQIDMYGNTKHAFTNPQAHDTNLGLIYDKNADKRSWIAMKDFFAEVLG